MAASTESAPGAILGGGGSLRTFDETDLREDGLGWGDRFRVPVGARLTAEAIEYAEEEGIELVFETYAEKARVLGRPAPEELGKIADAVAEGVFIELGRRALASGRARTPPPPPQERVFVLSAHGADRPGVVAAVAEVLAREEVNILEVSQKVIAGMFALIMLIDASASEVSLPSLRGQLQHALREIGVGVRVRRAVY